MAVKSARKPGVARSGKQNRYVGMLTLLVIVIGYTLYSSVFIKSVSFAIQGTVINVSDPFGHAYEMDVTELTGRGQWVDLNYGEAVNGGASSGLIYGTWKNEKLGTYQLCVAEKNTECIVLRSNELTLVFNYDSPEATRSLYQALEGLWASVGCDVPQI